MEQLSGKVQLTLQCEAVSFCSGRKLWVQVAPCIWLEVVKQLLADGLQVTGNWRVLLDQYDRHHGFSRVVARGYEQAFERAQLSASLTGEAGGATCSL